MDPQLHDLIHNNNLHLGLLRDLIQLIPFDNEGLDAVIGEAVASHDPRAFNYSIITALVTDRPVDSRHLVGGMALMASTDWMSCMVWKMQGEVAQHLVEGTRSTSMKSEYHATALLIAAAWSIEFRGGKQPPNLISDARLLARSGKLNSGKHALLWALAEMLDDSGLRGVLRAEQPRYCSPDIIRSAVEFGAATLGICRTEVIALIPHKPDNLIGSGPHVRRAVERIGRNDPCPCGSGQKYKRCCAGKDQLRMRHSSDVAGKTRAEVLAEPEPHLTEAKLKTLMPHDMARLDAAKLHPKLIHPYFMRLGPMYLLDECATAFEKLGCETKEMEEIWEFVMFYVVVKQRADVAHRLVKVRYKDEPVPDTQWFSTRLLLARDDPAHFLEVLEAGAQEALISKDGEWLSRFAMGLTLSPVASVGIHCARSLIPLISKENAHSLMESIQRARDRLNLPPDEPFGEILEKRFAEEVADGGKDAEALRKARQRMETKAAEVNQLKESMEKLRREVRLQEKKAPATAPDQAPAETPELRSLREKVKELKSSITERNNERATYRRELGQAYAELKAARESKAAAPVAEAPDAEDALLLPGEVESNQPPRPIEFPRRFHDTLQHLPRQTGRAALVLIGRIAAGDPSAFAGAIRLKAAPDVMRVRVGLDHRMLFRLLPESVQIVDLINRRDLEKCIASL